MADDEDDYLSDKFLALSESTPSQPSTYAERRKQAQKKSQLKNEQNRLKSRRVQEMESREEGLGTSLFQRAQEEASETGRQNKALAMMMKMGFQPGQSLGSGSPNDASAIVSATVDTAAGFPISSSSTEPPLQIQHRIEPLPIKEWTGKTGIGGIKRPPSPSTLERMSKVARQAEEMSTDEFRNRARHEYEVRRAEERLRHSQNTCFTLDTQEGIQFNRYWLNPVNPESFPAGLLAALEDMWIPSSTIPSYVQNGGGDSVEARLRSQMRADALQPLSSQIENVVSIQDTQDWSEASLEEVTEFLRMQAPGRLCAVLQYLRNKYNYCFWCGTQYASAEEMNGLCPGTDEDQHD